MFKRAFYWPELCAEEVDHFIRSLDADAIVTVAREKLIGGDVSADQGRFICRLEWAKRLAVNEVFERQNGTGIWRRYEDDAADVFRPCPSQLG